ncbi:MAG: T9SS type A sorting domain-containing protein, partial [Candidatus Marinimicrobia bacterium]|nr:T9SS type A sorting domain-containing protein [Candidatus Neomarinimicrobiota bacterium]
DHRFDLKMIAPDILIDYGASWYYYDAGDQPANRTLGTLSIRSDPEVALPDRLTLYPNYPNPFNAETFIQYYIAHPSEVTVTVYDILGRHVKTLAHGRQNNGIHKIKYDAGNLTSGVYFVKVQAAGEIKVRKMLLLK